MSFKFPKLIKNRKTRERERKKGKRQVFKLHAKRVSSAYHFDFSREIYCVAKRKKSKTIDFVESERERENLHIHKKKLCTHIEYMSLIECLKKIII